MPLPRFLDFLRGSIVIKEDDSSFEVHKSKREWTKALATYPQAKQHVDTLEALLSKPRTMHTEEESQTLQTRFNEHTIRPKAGSTRREKDSLDSYSNGYRIYRYHLPSSKGLPSGRITLNAAYATDHSHIKLLSVSEHQ